jgi:protein-histidine pros-kinase
VLAFDGRNPAVDDAIELVRAMARDLRPPVLDDLGLVAAVRSLVTREATRAGLEVVLDLAADDAELDDDIATAYYRILEAALQNIIAHAHARSIAVSLRDEPGAITLTVRDDGVGIARGARAGEGLVDMEQRLNLLGGELEIDSSPGAGTTIRARAPR